MTTNTPNIREVPRKGYPNKQDVAPTKRLLVTPWGRFNWPALSEPETFNGKAYYKTELLITKEDMMSEAGKAFRKGAILAARELLDNQSLRSIFDCGYPIVDMDGEEDTPAVFSGHIRIRARSQYLPLIVDP